MNEPNNLNGDNHLELKTLRRMCKGAALTPLRGRTTGIYYAVEAFAGTIQDPETGKYQKLRKNFNFNLCGSPEDAIADAKAWIKEMGQVGRAEKSAVISLPMKVRSALLFMVEVAEKEQLNPVEVFQFGLEATKDAKKEELDHKEAFRRGLELLKAQKVMRSISFKDAAALTIAQKKREENSDVYIKDLTGMYGRFGQDFNDCQLHMISAEQIEDWLEECEVGPVTWNNYRRQLGVLWNFGLIKRNRWIKENVIEEVLIKDVKTEAVTALTLAQAATILRTAHDQLPTLLPYLCVGMFAGLRRSEAQAAQWEDIDWESRSIKAVGGKMRSATDRFPHLEEVFIDWMKPIAQKQGPICTDKSTRRADLNKLRELTFDFEGNIFRHTFGTYHYHGFREPQTTMVEMGHTSLQMLHKHYRRPVPQTVAQKFWSLTRGVVLASN